jgi:acyl transferase domain-containing protein/acyl carrier protein
MYDGEIDSGIESIAIIGMSCRFPGARNLDEFWRNLREGAESISLFSDSELEAAGVSPHVFSLPNYVKAGGALDEIDLFDASFFGYTPREGEIIDPQQRLFLEHAWMALEHGGQDPETYEGRIGLFAGMGMNTYLLHHLQLDPDLIKSIRDYQTLLATDKDFLATRVSYKLNLRGPSVTVQTACSTSLVAVYFACQSLLNYQSDMALAGGISISVPQKVGYLYQEGGILSPDGRCRAFDAKAQGCVGGSGVGVVVLKRLHDAIADGDTIHAIIKGSAVNNDGSLKVGYTAPSVEGQAQVIAEALAVARIKPDTVTYVETHGTATPLGDPVEIAALTQAFQGATKQRGFCAIGSVKTNIGHLDTAAGIAGLIKTALALKHKQIPASLNFHKPNPNIDLANSPFYVNTKLSEWKSAGGPLRAGVSSFGIGGTNAHVVLEQAVEESSPNPGRPWQLLVLSAKTMSALEAATRNLKCHLEQQPETHVADLAYTLQVGRRAFSHRRAMVCKDVDDAVSALSGAKPGALHTGLHQGNNRPVAFMFPGQGSQYVNMARGLYESELSFRNYIDLCADIHLKLSGTDLRKIVYPSAAEKGAAAHQLNQTQMAQPALFIIEYALARLWMQWGICPEVMIGHSIGEYVAACLADVFSLEDTLRLLVIRGELMQRLAPGAMLAIPLSEDEVRPLLNEDLSLAAVNGPSLCVVSGAEQSIAEVKNRLVSQGVQCRLLQTSHAFHSRMVEPIVELFTAQVKGIKLNPPKIAFISNVTGAWITAAEATDPQYWGRHLRQTVRFAEGMSELLKAPDRLLLEVGPGRALAASVKRFSKEAARRGAFSSLSHEQGGQEDLFFALNVLGKLWLAGAGVTWRGLYAGERRRRLPLPTYPFERQRYWLESPRQPRELKDESTGRQKKEITDWFYIPKWESSFLSEPVAPADPARDQAGLLVLIGDHEFGALIVKRLANSGENLVTVKAGKGFRQFDERTYEIDPEEPADYVALCGELRAAGKLPRKIVHLWELSPVPVAACKSDPLSQVQSLGFYSLLFLAQALADQTLAAPIEIIVITNNLHAVTGDEILVPQKATILGPCKVIPQEIPKLRCRGIDIVLPNSGSKQEASLIEFLVTEMMTPSDDPVVAYRGLRRWIQRFEPVRLEKNVESHGRLRERGVYLITGGLGGIGLALAHHLAQTARARLALVSRSPFPEREEWLQWLQTNGEANETSEKIKKLLSLEALGAEVLVFSADVTKHEQMQSVLKQAQQLFGSVHGVIHAAGVAGGGMIQLKQPHAVASVFGPKVTGTLVLESLLAGTKLDFFVLCSAVSSILGGIGQIDYCAANAFLDAFAIYYASRYGGFTVAINWDAWQETGMAARAATPLSIQRVGQITGGGKKNHPLLDRQLANTLSRREYVTEFSVDRFWILNEHKFKGRAVIPATAYLEMARAAFEEQAGDTAIEIYNTLMVAPLMIENNEVKEVNTALVKQEDRWEFAIKSKAVAAPYQQAIWQEHARGQIRRVRFESTEKLDLTAIKKRMTRQNAEMPVSSADLVGGPRWQNLKSAYLGSNEALVLIELPAEFRPDLATYKLHPSLLDVATSFLHGIVGRGSYAPFWYRKLKMSAPLSEKLYSYICYRDEDAQKETLSFDVIISNEEGVELVKVEEFTMKRLSRAQSLAATEIDLPRAGNHQARERSSSHSPTGQTGSEQGITSGILTEDGVEAFSRILNRRVPPHVVVSQRNIPSLIKQFAAIPPRLADEVEKLRQAYERPELESPYVAPHNGLEHLLADLWQKAFGIARIGIHDNFFDLGGDSLLATQLVAWIRDACQVELPIASLFESQTIAELSVVVAKRIVAKASSDELSRLLEAVERLPMDDTHIMTSELSLE